MHVTLQMSVCGVGSLLMAHSGCLSSQPRRSATRKSPSMGGLPRGSSASGMCGDSRHRVQLARTRSQPHTAARACGSCVQAFAIAEVTPALLFAPSPGLEAGLLVNTAVYLTGIKVLLAGLTPAGVAHSWFLGTAVYGAFGAYGYGLGLDWFEAQVCLYFVLGSAVTKLKLKQKQAEGIAEARGGKRGPASVWGSGIAAIVCALGALSSPPSMLPMWRIGFVASLASKLNDTTASEVGKAYGKTTYLSTTFKPVPRGTEGAVSLEGTLAGAAAAGVIAVLALVSKQVNVNGCLVSIVAAFLANTFESMLGATVQGKEGLEWLTNDVVNMIQITLAAVTAMGFYALLPVA